jgi:hypothetical protein
MRARISSAARLKGERQDVGRRHALEQDQHPTDQSLGLAGARPGAHQQRASLDARRRGLVGSSSCASGVGTPSPCSAGPAPISGPNRARANCWMTMPSGRPTRAAIALASTTSRSDHAAGETDGVAQVRENWTGSDRVTTLAP